MFYSHLKKITKKFPVLWKFLTRLKDYLLKLFRFKDVVMMMLMFHIWPEQTYRFSTRKLLPGKNNRFSKESKPVLPYGLLEAKSSKIKKMKEIDLIGLGESFDLKNLKKITKPTFLISFFGPAKIDNNGKVFYKRYSLEEYKSNKSEIMEELFSNKTSNEFIKNNVTYVIGREEPVNFFRKNGYRILTVEVHAIAKDGNYYPLSNYWESASYRSLFNNDDFSHIAVAENVYRPPFLDSYPNWSPAGSFLPAICALSYFAEKINVYGWDFYLDSPAQNMNYWQLFFNMYKYNADVNRSKNHFESALINFYYAYKFSKLPNINIHGYMSKLDKHHQFIQKIERVLFN